MTLWLGTVASSLITSSLGNGDIITLGGGYYSTVSTNAIYKTNIVTGSDLTLWASTSWARYSMGSASNSIVSLAIGGHRSSSTTSDAGGNTFYRIDSSQFATSGTGSNFGSVRLSGNGYQGTGDSLYGYIYGGDCCGSSTYRSLRDRISFSTGGNSENWGSIRETPTAARVTTNKIRSLISYWKYVGGSSVYTVYTNIDSAVNSTSGNTSSFATISSPARMVDMSSSNIEGFTHGGYYYSSGNFWVSQIDKINYSTGGVTNSFGSVRNGTTHNPAVAGSHTEAMQFSYQSSLKTFDKFNYSTGGASSSFKQYGSLDANYYQGMGAPASNSHGGL